jgi:transcription initiation factor TFIID TATA-box-binding protein
MASLRVENVVATGDLDTRINFSDLLDRIDLPHLRYDPDVHQGLELRFIEEGPLTTVYATGKYIIRAPSISALQGTRDDLLDLLYQNGIIDEPEDKAFNINNVVGSGDIGREVELKALAEDLRIGEANYNPEEFPALRCRMNGYKATVLLYRSGKVIVTGANSIEGAEAAYEAFLDELDTLFARG